MFDRITHTSFLLLAALLLGGCEVAALVGGMAQNHEYQKQIEVLAEYDDLDDRTVAIFVNVDRVVMYEHAQLLPVLAEALAVELQNKVPNAKVIDPGAVLAWQYRHPGWELYGADEIFEELKFDRMIIVDIYEYRLHPLGNRYEWDGVCAAEVRIYEAERLDPAEAVDRFDIVARFPDMTGIGRESASERAVVLGLMKKFVERTIWLFHDHLEPKYPDKYRNMP